MDIIQEVNMTYILEFVIHFCFKSVINMGVTGKLYQYFPSKIKNWKILTALEKK
jgi:hypothetical protein